MIPEPNEDKPLQPEVPVQQKRFISVYTDALQDEYMTFKDPNLPLSERTRAGYRLLSTAAAAFKQHGDEKDSFDTQLALTNYVPPRWRSSITRTTNDMLVVRIFIGGATESSIDVPLANFTVALAVVKEQMFEEAYNYFARRIGLVMMRLASLGIIDEKPPTLEFSFAHLTAPLLDDDDEEDKEDDDAEPKELTAAIEKFRKEPPLLPLPPPPDDWLDPSRDEEPEDPEEDLDE